MICALLGKATVLMLWNKWVIVQILKYRKLITSERLSKKTNKALYNLAKLNIDFQNTRIPTFLFLCIDVNSRMKILDNRLMNRFMQVTIKYTHS